MRRKTGLAEAAQCTADPRYHPPPPHANLSPVRATVVVLCAFPPPSRGNAAQDGPRNALEGGNPPPSRAPSLCSATVSPTASAGFHGICNRQYPPSTASATCSNRLPNRLWGRLSGPFPSDAFLEGACGRLPEPRLRQQGLRVWSVRMWDLRACVQVNSLASRSSDGKKTPDSSEGTDALAKEVLLRCRAGG